MSKFNTKDAILVRQTMLCLSLELNKSKKSASQSLACEATNAVI